MRKEIKYKLNYRDKGEDKTINILIDFISNRTLKEYGDIMQMSTDAFILNSRMNELVELINECKSSKIDGWEEELKIYESEVIECKEGILEFNDNNYFDRRLKLLQRILTDNKLGDNEMLMSPEFWDEQVEPNELIKFMSTVVYKDIDKKKM